MYVREFLQIFVSFYKVKINMKPLYLSIEGINSFKQKQEIDFERLTAERIFCISGATGSGKTTILDCIVIALFAPAYHNRGTLKDYINTSCIKGEIVFRFGFEGGIYEVKRVLKESGTGGELLRLDTGEKLADQTIKITQKIEEMLKITDDDFRRVVVLEQGQFAKFLCATNNERTQSITNLFNLKRFEKLKNIFSDGYKSCQSQLDKCVTELMDYKDITDAKLTALGGEIKGKEEQLDLCRREIKSLEEKRLKAAAEAAKFLECENARAGVWAAQSALERLKDYDEKLKTQNARIEEFKTVLEGHKKVEGVARETLAKIEQSEADYSKIEQLENLRAKAILHYKEIKEKKVSCENKLSDFKILSEQKKLAAENCLNALRSILNLENILSDEGETVKADSTTFARLKAECVRLKEDFESFGNELKIIKTEETVQEKIRTYNENIISLAVKKQAELTAERKRLGELKQTAQSNLEDIRRHNAAAFVSQGLCEGDDCPVCGGVFHGGKAETGKTEQAELELSIIMEKFEELAKLELNNRAENSTAAAGLLSAESNLSRIHNELAAAKERQVSLNKKVNDFDKLSLENLSETVKKLERARLDCIDAEEGEKKASGEKISLAALSEQLASTEAEGRRIREEIDSLKNQVTNRLSSSEPLPKLKADALKKIEQYESGEKNLQRLTEIYNEQSSSYLVAQSAEKEKLRNAEEILLKNKDLKFDATQFERQGAQKAEQEKLQENLNEQLVTLKVEAQSLKEKIFKKRKLEAEKSSLSKKADNLLIMKKLFDKDKFLSYLSEEYIYNFTEEASGVLSELTDGKYSLLYEDDCFYVRDFLSENERRKVKTLSGGETFLASMSVAIAISRAIAADKHYEFFFLDEGFGTLHEKAIDTVAEALKKLSKDTIVGLVSHRSELTEKISSKLIIHSATEESGSTVEFING